MKELLTPFSCSRPSSEEQPGPPFVLRITRLIISELHYTAPHNTPKNQIIETPVRARREKPEKELTLLHSAMNMYDLLMAHLPRLVRSVADG